MSHPEPRRHARRPSIRFLRIVVAVVLAAPLAHAMSGISMPRTPEESGSGAVDDALLVELRPHVPPNEAAQLFAYAGVTKIGHLDELGVVVVSVPAAQRQRALQLLAADQRVAEVGEDSAVEVSGSPSDHFWSKQWGPRRIGAPEAWRETLGAASVVIAIVDTGVDPNQPDLRGRIIRGWDFQNDDSKPNDDDGHGTAVATVAAAAGNDRTGIAGMCWRCRIMPVKVLNSRGHGTHSNIAAGVIWAAKNGADVINLSIAGLSSTTVLAKAIAYAQRKGAIVVAAAGNEGTTKRTYPAAYPGVISVTATNASDRLYSWSNRGSWVTLSAPGCAYSGRLHGRWGWLCGTSLASPIVAGTVALMKSVAPGSGRARLTWILTRDSQRVTAAAGGHRLDAARAVRAAAGRSSP